MRRPSFSTALLLLLAVGLPSLAQAHTGVSPIHDLSHGMAHPLTGLDHLLAMLAVGLWAAQRGGRSLWAIPATFVGVMTLGGLLGMNGFALPFLEQGILLSVLLLGVLIAAAVRLPLWAGTLLVGTFALFHGFAHGAEMPTDASGFLYAAGFMTSTAFLHTIGLGLGMARLGKMEWTRLAGATVAICGAALWIS